MRSRLYHFIYDIHKNIFLIIFETVVISSIYINVFIYKTRVQINNHTECLKTNRAMNIHISIHVHKHTYIHVQCTYWLHMIVIHKSYIKIVTI